MRELPFTGPQGSTWGTPTTTVAAGFADLGFRFLYVGAFDVQWDNGFGLGLLYVHARRYSLVLGHFIQPDPARADASTTVTIIPATKVVIFRRRFRPIGSTGSVGSSGHQLRRRSNTSVGVVGILPT